MDIITIFTAPFITLIAISTIIPRTKMSVTTIANLVITMGILGIFIGVFIGLLSFDPDNIQASVPTLHRFTSIAKGQYEWFWKVNSMVSKRQLTMFVRLYPAPYRTKFSKQKNIYDGLSILKDMVPLTLPAQVDVLSSTRGTFYGT